MILTAISKKLALIKKQVIYVTPIILQMFAIENLNIQTLLLQKHLPALKISSTQICWFHTNWLPTCEEYRDADVYLQKTLVSLPCNFLDSRYQLALHG
jgi:hypothetical protein